MHLKRRYKLNDDSEHSKHRCRINFLNFLFEKGAIKETEITDGGNNNDILFESYMYIPLAKNLKYRTATPKEFFGGKNSIHINDEIGQFNTMSPEEVLNLWNQRGVLLAEPEKDEWISVEDYLPENDDEVLAFWIGWDDMEVVRSLSYESGCEEWTDWNGQEYHKILKWKPIDLPKI